MESFILLVGGNTVAIVLSNPLFANNQLSCEFPFNFIDVCTCLGNKFCEAKDLQGKKVNLAIFETTFVLFGTVV